MVTRIFPLLVLPLVWACSAAPSSETEASRTQAIVGGTLDTEHHNVFGTVSHVGGLVGSCTATLIAPNLLLTARHCITAGEHSAVICGRAEFGETLPANQIFATNAVDFDASTRWFKGLEVAVPTEGDDLCGFDVALITLDSNVPASVAVPAVPRIDREVQLGEAYAAVGYGVRENGRAGQRRFLGDLSVECEPGRCGSSVKASEFVGDAGICEGDSGGPALDSDGKVVGIVSRGLEDCGAPIYSDVASWKDLITEVATRAATLGGYEAPFWVKSGSSEPPKELPPPPKLGDECSGPEQCPDASACYKPNGEEHSFCVARCETNADCGATESCTVVSNAGDAVCLAAQVPEQSEGGCSLRGGAASWQWFGAAALALLARSRRRAR